MGKLASTVDVWSETKHYTDSAGVQLVKELSSLVMSLLSLPHSNAEVGRHLVK